MTFPRLWFFMIFALGMAILLASSFFATGSILNVYGLIDNFITHVQSLHETDVQRQFAIYFLAFVIAIGLGYIVFTILGLIPWRRGENV